MKGENKCADCGVYISDVSTRCKSCSKIYLYDTPERKNRNEEIISLYGEGNSSKDIASLYGISQTLVQKIAHKAELKWDWRKYKIDDDILDTDSAFKYYILGLFATDGCVSKNRNSKFIELTLNERDRVLLEDIKKGFNTDKPLSLGKDGCLKLTLFSKKLYNMLESFGICRNKSLVLKISKTIPQKYLIHFLRGCFDGDGYITGKNNADITLCCSASKKFAEQIVEYYNNIECDVNLYSYSKNRKNTLYIVKKCGKNGLGTLAKLYAQSGLFMPRKYLKFLEFIRLTVDEVMMEVAHTFAKRSICLRRKVGCVITNEEKNNIVSIGYNGTPSNEPNHCESSFPGQCGCIHAEQNALLKGNGSILYSTTMPCKNCAKSIVNAGIKTVYYDADYRYSYAVGLFNRSKISCRKISRLSYKWKNDIAKILEWKNE